MEPIAGGDCRAPGSTVTVKDTPVLLLPSETSTVNRWVPTSSESVFHIIWPVSEEIVAPSGNVSAEYDRLSPSMSVARIV